MASDKIKHALSDEGIREAENELAFLFRKTCRELGMMPRNWEARLQSHMDRDVAPRLAERQRLAEPGKTRTAQEEATALAYAKGNINTQLLAPTMTWRTFMEAMRFLGPVGVDFTLKLHWPHGTFTEHTISVRGRSSDVSILDEMLLTEDIPTQALKSGDERVAAAPTVTRSANPDDVPDL